MDTEKSCSFFYIPLIRWRTFKKVRTYLEIHCGISLMRCCAVCISLLSLKFNPFSKGYRVIERFLQKMQKELNLRRNMQKTQISAPKFTKTQLTLFCNPISITFLPLILFSKFLTKRLEVSNLILRSFEKSSVR